MYEAPWLAKSGNPSQAGTGTPSDPSHGQLWHSQPWCRPEGGAASRSLKDNSFA